MSLLSLGLSELRTFAKTTHSKGLARKCIQSARAKLPIRMLVGSVDKYSNFMTAIRVNVFPKKPTVFSTIYRHIQVVSNILIQSGNTCVAELFENSIVFLTVPCILQEIINWLTELWSPTTFPDWETKGSCEVGWIPNLNTCQDKTGNCVLTALSWICWIKTSLVFKMRCVRSFYLHPKLCSPQTSVITPPSTHSLGMSMSTLSMHPHAICPQKRSLSRMFVRVKVTHLVDKRLNYSNACSSRCPFPLVECNTAFGCHGGNSDVALCGIETITKITNFCLVHMETEAAAPPLKPSVNVMKKTCCLQLSPKHIGVQNPTWCT